MQPRKPRYRDLLEYLTQDQLDQFISRLTTAKSQGKLSVTYSTEVDQPVYYNYNNIYYYNYNRYHHTAICCAAAINDLLMAESLLKIGADPNIPDLCTLDASALSTAVERSQTTNSDQMLQILLAAPSIELYIINALGQSIFLRANGDAAFVLKLLSSDPLVSLFTYEEKQEMSNKIAAATKSRSAFETNTVICETLNTAYLNVITSLETQINEACQSTTGQPITATVLSYLFRPEEKPHSLKRMENWVLNHNTRTETQEETKKACRIS